MGRLLSKKSNNFTSLIILSAFARPSNKNSNQKISEAFLSILVLNVSILIALKIYIDLLNKGDIVRKEIYILLLKNGAFYYGKFE